jgi:hypothetical protein
MIGRWKRRGNHLATARLAVRPHLTWYAQVGIGVGFCVVLAIGVLAAYRYGERTGISDDSARLQALGASQAAQRLSAELADVHQRMDTMAQQLRVEESTRDTLAKQIQQLQADNGALREKVAFYESLLTTTDRAPALSLEGLHVEPLAPGRYRLRAVLVQGQSSQEAFKGEVDFRLVMEHGGKRTETVWPQPRIPVTVARFAQVVRETELPADTKLREVEVRVYAQGDNHVRISRTYDVKG